jgi:hypothetical protein
LTFNHLCKWVHFVRYRYKKYCAAILVGLRGIGDVLVTSINQKISTKMESDISVRLHFCARQKLLNELQQAV